MSAEKIIEQIKKDSEKEIKKIKKESEKEFQEMINEAETLANIESKKINEKLLTANTMLMNAKA